MKVRIVYVFPNISLRVYEPLAKRFVKSYQEYPPGEYPHELVVVANAFPVDNRQKNLFSPLPIRFENHNNYAKDIGAFYLMSLEGGCDLQICLGANVHFHRVGWLDRIIEVYLQLGPGLYGCWGFSAPSPHIRTTAFWMPPELLAAYPHPVTDRHRYSFEHGINSSILAWAQKCQFPAYVVGWTKIWTPDHFDETPNEEYLLLDQWCDRGGNFNQFMQ